MTNPWIASQPGFCPDRITRRSVVGSLEVS